jgi:predicted  nucleic acid-binding Zn-ribbon protein
VTRKIDLKKIKKQREPDELEKLFSQFDQQLQACEDKIGMLKKSITELEMKKTGEDEAEETQEEPTPTHSPYPD